MTQASLLSRIVVALRHQRLAVACIVGLGLVAALILGASVHRKFTATTTVLMVAEPTDSSNSEVPFTATKPLLTVDLPSLATDATVLERFRRDIGENVSLETLRSRIRAKVNLDSSLMPVQYTASRADLAIWGANDLGDEIVRFYRELATTRFDSLIRDLNSQLAGRRRELARLDSELAVVSKAYPYIDVESPGTADSGTESVYHRLITLRSERDDLVAAVRADDVNADSSKRLLDDATPMALQDAVNNDVSYQVYRKQYDKDLAALKYFNGRVKQGYPGLAELHRIVSRDESMMATARKSAASAGPSTNAAYVAALDAQARADAQLAGDEARLQSEDRALHELQSQIGRGSVATDAAQLRRNRDNAEAAYATLANRLAKSIADRAEAASTGSVIVLDHAQFAQRVALSSGKLVAAIILLLATWLALTIAVMIDSNQEWFHDARSIEKFYDAPLMGSLPKEAALD